MQFVDTHCHIHEITGPKGADQFVRNKWHDAGVTDADTVLADALEANVSKLLCVGTTYEDSQLATEFVQGRQGCYATIGIHPHEAKDHINDPDKLQNFCNLIVKDKVMAIGEFGLDYFYEHSPKKDQLAMLEIQLELASKHNLPCIFHIRDAFDDFWPVFDSFSGIGGVVHSFSSGMQDLEQILSRELYVGLNGIMTFTNDAAQLEAAKNVPLQKLLLETDAPFLTPSPFRGTICEPKHVVRIAEFLSDLRQESLEQIAIRTTKNATEVFNLV